MNFFQFLKKSIALLVVKDDFSAFKIDAESGQRRIAKIKSEIAAYRPTTPHTSTQTIFFSKYLLDSINRPVTATHVIILKSENL